LCHQLEELFSWTFFIQGFANTFVLCSLVFKVASAVCNSIFNDSMVMNSSFVSIQDDVSNFAFCLSYGFIVIFQTFWPSFFGNEIEVTSDSTLNAIYASDWISADEKFKKLCLIAMENVKKPIKLRALRIFDVNLESFLFV